jgi:deoxyribonuclease-4
LNNELELIKNLPAAVIVHCGKVGTISKISESINSLNLRRGTFRSFEKQLLLENASGQGTELGKNLDEIRKIFEGIDKNLVGMCIDTQHTFASGVCSFREKKDVDELFENYSDFGLRVIHLNDSKTDFNSRVDRHENIGAGKIWGENVSSLKYLLNKCSDKKIDMILETPNQLSDYERLKVFIHNP